MFVLIPARGGSKGVPGKNIKHLNGKPLIYYTIEAARKLFDDDQIVVSTDDVEIKSVVEKIGLKVPFLRPSNLATDSSSSRDVVLHAVQFLESLGQRHETVVLLQPTSPFRTSGHIEGALEVYSSKLDMVVSVKLTKSNPYYVLLEEDNVGNLKKSKKADFTRRQDVPDVWEINGAIYVINTRSIEKGSFQEMRNIRKYVMTEEDSIDIDSKYDWDLAEFLIRRRGAITK